MIEQKDIIRRSKAELLSSLASMGADVSRPNAIRCPFHEDKHASAGVYEDEGVWRFKCHASCCKVNFDVFDVRQRVTGKTVASQLVEIRDGAMPNIKPARTFDDEEKWKTAYAGKKTVYRYVNPDTGKPDLLILRVDTDEGKAIRQAHVNAEGRIVERAPAKPYPIYNRTRIKGADDVLVVEGEKCVHAVADVGYVATTSPGGAGKGRAADADWRPLAGKNVILWPDHDPVGEDGDRGGHRHMRDVAEQLKTLDPPCSIWWINPDLLDMDDKQDVADYLLRFPEDRRADALSDAIDSAVPMGGTSEVRDFFNDIIAGKWKSLAWPFKIVNEYSRSLLPGTVTVIAGDPGSNKSILVTQSLIHWTQEGRRCAVFMLEDDRKFHLQRIVAQLDKNERLTDPDWIESHPKEAMEAVARHESMLDKIGKALYDAPDESPTYDSIIAWMQRVADGGAEIIVIDPITAIDSGKEPWIADKNFMAKAKSILRKHKSRLVLVTHPRSSNNKAAHDDIAGSRAFGRFCQSMFWMRRLEEPTKVFIRDPDTKAQSYGIIDRLLKFVKVRNGKGQNLNVAMTFNNQELALTAQGFYVKKANEED